MKGKKLVLAALCGVGVIVVGLGLWNYKRIANGIKKLTASPTEYFRYVEERSSENTAKMLGTYYELIKQAYDFETDRSYNGSLNIELGSGAKKLFKKTASVDVSGLSEVTFTTNSTLNENASLGEASAAFSLNGKEMLNAAFRYDLEEKLLFLEVPTISEQSLVMDLDELMDGEATELKETIEQMSSLVNAFPDKETAGSMFQRYFRVALSCIDDVEEETCKLSAEGISNTYTKLTVSLDGKTVYRMIETVIEEILEDEELERLISEIAQALETDEEESYDAFCGSLETLLEESKEIKSFREDIQYSVWVDATGNIVGRYLEIEDVGEFLFALPQKGRKFGYETSIEINDKKISLRGEGKVQGNKLSGSFQLKVFGERIAKFDLDGVNPAEWRKSKGKGTITIRPAGAVEEILEEMAEKTGYRLKNPAVLLSVDVKNNTFSVAIENNEELLLRISRTQTESAAGKVSLPEKGTALEIKEEADLLKWFAGADLDGFFTALKEEGIPSEWLEWYDEWRDLLDYEIALKYVEQGEYQQAKEMLFALGDYGNAEEYVIFCEAMLCFEEGNTEKAISLYHTLEYYILYSDVVSESCYRMADRLLAEKKYEEAAFLYQNCYQYEDATTKKIYATAMWEWKNGGCPEDAESQLASIENEYPDAAEDLKECRYQLGIQALENGYLSSAANYFHLIGEYKDSAEKMKEIEEELTLLQMPEHQLYPVNYKDFVQYVTFPENYLGIPLKTVTDAELDEYIAVNTSEYALEMMSEETREYYREMCTEEKYAYAIIDYLNTHSVVSALDEESVQNKAIIARYRFRNKVEDLGFEWESFLENVMGYTDEQILEAYADEYRNQEQAFLICYAIAQKEGIRITEEEFDYFVADFSADFGVTTEDFLRVNPKDVLDEIFLIEKTMLFLIENAEVQ